jgi:hypothetical protein
MHAPNTLNHFEFSRGKTGNKVVFSACAAILFVDFEKGANINKAIKLKILIIFERKNRQIIVVEVSRLS